MEAESTESKLSERALRTKISLLENICAKLNAYVSEKQSKYLDEVREMVKGYISDKEPNFIETNLKHRTVEHRYMRVSLLSMDVVEKPVLYLKLDLIITFGLFAFEIYTVFEKIKHSISRGYFDEYRIRNICKDFADLIKIDFDFVYNAVYYDCFFNISDVWNNTIVIRIKF